MKKNNTPFVSFIIPTFNAASNIEICLKSIKKQDYPKNRYEILVVDGRSDDQTVEIAKKYNVKILDNPFRDPESAKFLGIKHSNGQIIALVDSDNEIIKRDWLRKMVRPLLIDPSLFGVESFYFPKKGESIWNTYCMIAHIADPFSRCLAGKLIESRKNDYVEYTIPKGSTYPLGANGFLWNKRIIDEIKLNQPKFEESNFSYFVLEKGHRRFARIPGFGIYHQHVASLKDFINKRLKIGNKFLNRKINGQKTWLEGVSKAKFIYCVLYCGTFVGPFIEGMINYLTIRQKAWLLHPFMAFISVVCYGFVFFRRRLIN